MNNRPAFNVTVRREDPETGKGYTTLFSLWEKESKYGVQYSFCPKEDIVIKAGEWINMYPVKDASPPRQQQPPSDDVPF